MSGNDANRRQQEINMFAAFATGAASVVDDNDDTADKDDIVKSTTPAAAPAPSASGGGFDFAAAIRADNNNNKSSNSSGGGGGFDFASAIRADNSSSSGGGGGGGFDFASAIRADNGGGGGGGGGGSFSFTPPASKKDDASGRDAFTSMLQAESGGDSSGTFNFSRTTSGEGGGGSSIFTKSQNQEEDSTSAHSTNIQAALAAFESEDPSMKNSAVNGGGSSQKPLRPTKRLPEAVEPFNTAKAPMFSQKVSLARPLFFGAILPPRVVREARAMVVDAYKELDYYPGESDPTERPTLSQLPPCVRNVVGAVRTYGYGINILGDDDPMEENPESYWKGDARVTTYQPLWAEAERAARIATAEAGRQRPSSVVNRALTAPASLGGSRASGNVMVDAAAAATSALNPLTEAGQTTHEGNLAGENGGDVPFTRQTQNEQFSSWLRGDDDSVASPTNAAPQDGSLRGSASSLRSSFEATPAPSLEGSSHGNNTAATAASSSAALTERELFARWAAGGGGDTLVSSDASSSLASRSAIPFDRSTFQRRAPPPVALDSDDDSVDYDEQKKQVGLNDNLSKAQASLADDQPQPDQPALETTEHVLLSQIPTDGSKRPLTNYEVTDGCVPAFGVDDPPLPGESDLGIHETKEEQQRTAEARRAQEIVEKMVAPNVFGAIACPNPALQPDDFHSWNSRATGNQRLPRAGTVESLSLPSFNNGTGGRSTSGKQRDSTGGGSTSTSKRYRSRTRYGWWNVGNEKDWPATVTKQAKEENGKKDSKGTTPSAAKESIVVEAVLDENQATVRQLPPIHHSATALQVVTPLEPTPGQLQKENLPLSKMDASTSAAQTLPYLSDRPPSYRYLQIDTQAVAFPPTGGEIEPFFCTLAIYNVETVSGGNSSVTAGEQAAAPVPDLQRCGRVTEALHFDIVRDTEIAKRCTPALWPSRADSPFAKLIAGGNEPSSEPQSVGTRCGVFPLPSNLSFSNLYAVLIVHRVLSEDSLDIYHKQSSGTPLDLEKLRAGAEKAASRHAPFLLPFCFGVAPVLQVFAGSENPVITSSRAVQIPLFRFSPGLGERQIIDHIMVMLNPRADRRAAGMGGPAAPTNGGTAMLVMRSFGFLGLHQVVDSASRLARERLVDFTGELQLRRSDESDTEPERPSYNGFSCRAPDWFPKFTAEPAVRGGRATADAAISKSIEPPLYAQELAPRSLQYSPLARMTAAVQSNPHRGRLHGGHDIEPYFHTAFCNEMLLHPRLLHNCPKGNIVVKTELREIEWDEGLSAYFAHLPRSGPSMHNTRRGPHLVQSLFTSCSPRGSNKHFMDEFKMKLPLDLRPAKRVGIGRSVLALFFTVYNIKMSSKSKWKISKKLFASSDNASVTKEEVEGSFRIEQIACGFLPISADTCLIDDGLHDVRIIYSAQPAPAEYIKQGKAVGSSLVLREKIEGGETSSAAGGREHSMAEETTMSNNSDNVGEGVKADQSVASASDLASMADESQSRSDKEKKNNGEPISLSVRLTVHSSVHAQNETLSQMLELEHMHPYCGKTMDAVFLSKLRMGRDFLTSSIESIGSRRPSSIEVKLFESCINIVKSQVCPITHSYGHVYRIYPILWRTLLCGTGDPDLNWANPAAPIPLRLHTFATILQLLGGVSLYLQKNGMMQVDGMTKWNIVTLGRVVALLFDEEQLFGGQATESFDKEKWSREYEDSSESERLSSPVPLKPSLNQRRKRHTRNNFEFLDILNPGDAHAGADDSSAPTEKSKSQARPSVDDSDVKLSSSYSLAPSTSAKKELKVDSKSDFQSALRAAAASADDHPIDTDGGRRANAMIQAFGPGTGSRRWMTAPIRALTTISETEDGDGLGNFPHGPGDALSGSKPLSSIGEEETKPTDPMDLEMKVNIDAPKKPVKQMRIPKSSKQTDEKSATLIEKPSALTQESRQSSLPRDHEIESAGSAFLDVIGKSLGMSKISRMNATEEQRVGSSHHRKTRSNSSIDWTLLGDSLVTNTFESAAPISKGNSEETTEENDNEALSALKSEEKNSVRLPDFVERLMNAGKSSSKKARWFPFAYEVVILQWAAVLVAQRAAGEKGRSDGTHQSKTGQSSRGEVSLNQSVSQAAARSIGVAVAGAPLLFEIIKHSLGFRIHTLYEEVLKEFPSVSGPPLLSLDDALQAALEQVVSMVADACIDSRNFDSWDLRQMSINVNDSIVRFLRDMFSFLSPASTHRLVLAYLSRFVTREGKQTQDRDSSIGLRCSWEITKLRLNAVTGLVRFPDFVRVNSPQMLNWSNWWMPQTSRSDSFFAGILERYRKYRLYRFVGGDDNTPSEDISIPSIHPHWLAEIVIDICLLGTEHVEPQIQQRSTALLLEMFWNSSQEGILMGRTGPVASMYLTFLEKILLQVNFLSNFAPKSQLRKDLLPCVVFVLQSTPSPLLRALWRWLCEGLPGKSLSQEYGGFVAPDSSEKENEKTARAGESRSDVLDMFKILNLALKTMEYEGSDENIEGDTEANSEPTDLWRREFLLSTESQSSQDMRNRRRIPQREKGKKDDVCTSTTSRRWHAHDGSLVIINAGHQLVLELYGLLHVIPDGQSFLNPAIRSHSQNRIDENVSMSLSRLSKDDVVLFVRAATSLYLHALALRESDIASIRAFKVTAEIIKIFGIKTFLEAVGETLQHWMRVISLHCGARRANVRIEATDLLELMLRSTWDCYGSFFRIRVPLLAVQTEVMERIVATAATRYYRDQRRFAKNLEPFSNVSAEASLVPLWRTLDRMEKQPASQNVAFRGALVRMSRKLKQLYRAYIAARVLSFIQGTRSSNEPEEEEPVRDHSAEALIRANRISILRVINASDGHSKQFLGFHATTQQRSHVAHFEAVEDALIDAADVFSPTELPEHRVAWLRMLADFHSSRKRYAEEATCHFEIHVTLQQAAQLHGSLWSNTPFLPWTDNMPDPVVYIDGAEPDPDFMSEYGIDETDGQYANINSFRRIFYRVANSVAIGQDDWDTSGRQNLFCGISSLSEYFTVSPWLTLRGMEEEMVEEAEAAGDLFLTAGIIESSRFAWRLATEFYSQRFNYSKLAIAYTNLARTVVSKVPQIDASLPQEVSAILGRFYRVWFHGGAPDDLNGIEFVYRTEGTVRLDQFGQELREVMKSIIPDKTPIHLVLDGRSETRLEDGPQTFGFRIGPTPLEPVRIKVTPLRPLFVQSSRTRGMPEWFFRYADEAFSDLHHRRTNEYGRKGSANTGGPGQGSDMSDPHHQREHARSYSASVFSSMGTSAGGNLGSRPVLGDERASRFTGSGDSDLSGVDKFCFVQPKDRSRGSKDWWKYTTGDYALKSLKVTQLQVAQNFPACVARQPVVHRLVYSHSPLEAGIDAVCQWCAVLFRTAVATIGMAVLGTNADPGIGTDAVKVVVDCIHSSQVKEIGLSLMTKTSDNAKKDHMSEFTLESYDRLSDAEIEKLQLKLARLIVVFFELLHLLITRNRQRLLNVMNDRKTPDAPAMPSAINMKSQTRSTSASAMEVPTKSRKRQARSPGPRSTGSHDISTAHSYNPHHHSRKSTTDARSTLSLTARTTVPEETRSDDGFGRSRGRRMSEDQQSVQSLHTNNPGNEKRTGSAIAVQGELQRAFINMAKALYPKVQGIMGSDTPRWFKQCAQESYFSLGTYKQTKVPIAEEIGFNPESMIPRVASAELLGQQGNLYERGLESPRGSIGGSSHHSVVSRGSQQYGYGQF